MKAELSRKVVLGAKRTELPKNGLGNTDEKYLPYAVLKVQKITVLQKRIKVQMKLKTSLS